MPMRTVLVAILLLTTFLPASAQDAPAPRNGSGNGSHQVQKDRNSTDGAQAPVDGPIEIGNMVGTWSIERDTDGRPFATTPARIELEGFPGEIDRLSIHCDQPFGIRFEFEGREDVAFAAVTFDPDDIALDYHLSENGIGRVEAVDLADRMTALEARTGKQVLVDFLTDEKEGSTSTFDVIGIERTAQFMDDRCKQF